ncbi:MAG: CDGSH iron-sulfur domain-containing protein [Paracoccaceae bacterium]|nr:CDGSH iron-sulfur domain-containing protein [Paracoccaceae bacterium]
MAKTYKGANIEIGFDMKRCIHARNCYLKLPQVFDPSRRPWVEPDAAPAEEIAAMIRTCPSGALTFRRLDDGLNETPPRINRVAVLENGPIALAGDLNVEGEAMARATLCRCGASGNKPFCDYAHVDADFSATGEPQTDANAEAIEMDGPLIATAIPDGPLKLEGPMELTTGTGKGIGKMRRAFLCRCGASKNKPFCDGSHKEIGFEG